MKFKLLLVLHILLIKFSLAQDRTFSYVGKYTSEDEIRAIADSLNKPLLVCGDKVYSIGSDCITRLFDGDLNDRNKNGDNEDRKKKGNKNNRNKNGDGNDRNKNGDNDERDKGGDVGYRNKKANKNNRNKDGDDNDRNKNGDDNDRDKDGDQDSRNADGAISNGPRCSTAKNGKLLLYTRQEINSKNSTIYYKGKSFTNKYFKIIQL